MSDEQPTITADEFRARLASLCLKTGQPGMPRKRRDQHIILKSAVLTLDPETTYDETELGDALQQWQRTVGRELLVDHVSMRRHLVDDGYLERDPEGTAYRVAPTAPDLFEPDVKTLDPGEIVTTAELERIEKKLQYMADRTADQKLESGE